MYCTAFILQIQSLFSRKVLKKKGSTEIDISLPEIVKVRFEPETLEIDYILCLKFDAY